MKISEMNPAELRAWRIKAIVERDGPLCFHPDCLKPFVEEDDITFDHWVPQSKGGDWSLENLRIMHKRCNAIKSDIMPNPDGTLPARNRPLNAFDRKMARKAIKVDVCTACKSGRALGPEEFCEVCGSTAMPFSHPAWAKMKPQDCEHAGIWWCWACMSGIIEREPAIMSVLDAEGSLDNQ